MSPFAAATQADPPSGQKLVHDCELRPRYNILTLAELQGSGYVLTGDGKGCISAFPLLLGQSLEEPQYYFEGHTGAISKIVPLKSARVPKFIEEKEWPEDAVAATLDAAMVRRSSEISAQTEKGEEGAKVVLEPPKKPSIAARLCGFCRKKKNDENAIPKAAARNKKEQRHWLVATVGIDGALRVWRWRLTVTKKETEWDVDLLSEWKADNDAALTSAIEMPDGHLAISKQDSPDILLVDPSTCALRWVLFGHTAAVSAFAICADGRLVSGGCDGAVRLWARRARSRAPVAGEARGPSPPAIANSAPGQVDCGTSKPGPPALMWSDPGAEKANAGVSSMAFFAHMHQEERSECLPTTLRILIRQAENIPATDLLSAADPYVVVSVLDADTALLEPMAQTSAVAPFGNSAVWDEQLALGLTRCFMDGQWGKPECAQLNFEVVFEKARGGEQVLAQCSMSLRSVLAEAKRCAGLSDMPKAYKLFSPPGQGPFKDLRAAVMFLTFGQPGENDLRIFVSSVDGVPSVGAAKLSVRVTLKQTLPGKARRLPAPVKDRTKMIENDGSPLWNEILEIEIPGTLKESTLFHSGGMCVHFALWEYNNHDEDELIGGLTLPISELRQYDDGQVRPFNLDMKDDVVSLPGSGGGMFRRRRSSRGSRSPRSKSPSSRSPRPRGAGGSSQGLRAAADASERSPSRSLAPRGGAADAAVEQRLAVQQPAEGRLAKFAPSKSPRIFLGFSLLTPCPVQLRCTVEQAMGIPIPNNKIAPQIRMRFVEGNPMLPHFTSFKTSTKKANLKPVWRERCVLPVPLWLVQAVESKEAPMDATATKSSERWEHPRPPGHGSYAIVCDVHDRDILSEDDLLGRVVVPFADVWNFGCNSPGSNAYPLQCSNGTAVLYLDFERTARPDHLVVCVDRADNLPGGDAERADPYVVVRLAEVDTFGEPPDRSSVRAHLALETEPAPTGARDHAYRHEELLELPGGVQEGMVAMRPNWHLLFEVLDANSPPDTKEPVLARAAVPLSDVLKELKAAEESKKPPAGLEQRIQALRSPIGTGTGRGSKAPPDAATRQKEMQDYEESRPVVVRELALVKASKRQELGQATASMKYLPSALESQRGSDQGKLQSLEAEAAWAEASAAAPAPKGAKAASSSARPTGGEMVLVKQDKQERGTARKGGAAAAPVGTAHEPTAEAVAAVQALGAGALTAAALGSRSMLLVRFHAVDRWQGTSRGPKRPPPRPMQGPSPVTCLATLTSSIVAGHEDGNIFVWDSSGATPWPLHRFSAHKAPVACITYFPLLDCLVTGGGCRTRGEALTDAVVRVWNCSAFELRQSLPLHGAAARLVQPLDVVEDKKKNAGQVQCLALSTDNRQQRMLQLLRVEGKPKEDE